jgi:hypothetical protein
MISAPDGYQYGVRFESDGSVVARWSGRTQRARAAEEVDRLHLAYHPDRFTLVRRRPDGEWEELPDDECEGDRHVFHAQPGVDHRTCECGAFVAFDAGGSRRA